MIEPSPYAEMVDTAFLVPTATRPTLVRLALACRYWPIPVPRPEWDALSRPDRDLFADLAADKLRPYLLMDDRWTVGSVRAVDIVDRGKSFPEMSLGFVTGTPRVPGVRREHLDSAWDAGMRQLLVLSRSALPEGWGHLSVDGR
jgi:hypothetical protein